nr:hypothetical protein [Tanacetum cinerariifolium]
MISAQIVDLSSHTTKYASPITQKVFADMRKVGKGFFGVDTPLFKGMLVPQQAADDVADVVADDVDVVADADAEPTPPSPTPTTTLLPPQQEDKIAQAIKITRLKQMVRRLEKKNKLNVSGLKRLRKGGIIAKLDTDEDVTLKEVVVEAEKNAEVAKKDVDAQGRQEDATRRRKGVVIKDPKETSTPSIIVHFELKSKDKGKGIMVEELKPLKKQAHIEQDEAYARKPIFEKLFNLIVGFLEKGKKELEEEASKALKRKSESLDQQAAKKQKLDEEVEELKTHLQIVSNDEDDVDTEATPLALKLFLSFISLLRNFDREDLEMLWQIVQERFASSKPKNFSDNFLLNSLKTMFEKPNVETHTWKNQRGSYGLAKVKGAGSISHCYEDLNVCFEVDVVEDFKEYTLRDYYCWLKTYCCWYKLKLLDNAAEEVKTVRRKYCY